MVDAASRAPVPNKPDANAPRWKRRLALVAALGSALVVSICVGGKLFLGSQHFKGMLADRLQNALNGRLHFSSVDVGLNATSMHDVVLVEQSSEQPWAKIEHVEAEMPLLKLLGGSPDPELVHLHKIDVTLRFDSQNHLLTALPEKQGPLPPLPPIRLDEGTLTIAQEGREPFHLSNLTGQAITKAGKLSFNGTVNDPIWGAWNVALTYDLETSVSQMNLKSKGVAVKQAMLSALPFVSPKVWKHVECNGATSAEVTFRKEPGADALHYRAVLEPSETQVRITSIDLLAQHASGKIVIDDRLVTLSNVSGQAADGTIATSGTLDFRQPVFEHQFAVAAKRLQLHLLPKRWKIPSTLSGRLTGTANLAVKIGAGKESQNAGRRQSQTSRREGVQRESSIHLPDAEGPWLPGQAFSARYR